MSVHEGFEPPRRPPDTHVPYGGYHQREVPQEDPELTHVGPGTPCGEYMRRFWWPVCLSEQVTELPLAIRILGEDLVAFRDKSDRIGVLHRHCSHRGTSLEYGIPSERGIRCCYHGWLFDVDGRILETPGEPSDSKLKDSFVHGAYPAFEYQGLVFAYLGPPEEKARFPDLRYLRGARHLHQTLLDLAPLQLPAGDGQPSRLLPLVLPAQRQRQRRPRAG